VWNAPGRIEVLSANGSLSGVCLDGSCPAAEGQCHPVGLGDCETLGEAAVFTRGKTPGHIISQHGHALDYGVYCSGCKPSLGLASSNPAFTWEDFAVNLSSVGAPSISVQPQAGTRCCVTAIGMAHTACADAIHAACPGLQGNECITCVEKHSAGLSPDCPDLNSQMHGVCGALESDLPGKQAACNATTKAVRKLIDDLDAFVGSHPLWLLGNWTVSSRVGAADKADADNLEYGARNLVTLWGGDEGGDLAGYDGKIWSGLLSDYYGPIWEMLLEAMRTEAAGGAKIDPGLGSAQFAFSSKWVRQTNPYPTTPAADNADPVEAAKTLIAKYAPGAVAVAKEWDVVPNTAVAAGFGIPLGRAPGKIYDTDVGVLSQLCKLHPECVGFEVPGGSLLANVAEVARSKNASSTLYVEKS
jgi:hypothetical protein